MEVDGGISDLFFEEEEIGSELEDLVLDDELTRTFGPEVVFTAPITTVSCAKLVSALNEETKQQFDLESTAEGGFQLVRPKVGYKSIRFNFGQNVGAWPPLSPSFSLEAWRRRPPATIWLPFAEPSVGMLLAGKKTGPPPGRGRLVFVASGGAAWSRGEIDRVGAVFEKNGIARGSP